MRCPFYLQKKKTGKGPVWYARFWNEKVKDYTLARSTGIIAEGKKERRRGAELKARGLLSEIRFETEAVTALLFHTLRNFGKRTLPMSRNVPVLKRIPSPITMCIKTSSISGNILNPAPCWKKLPCVN
jgi:hypothetical protein